MATDMRFTDEYCIVLDKDTDDLILASLLTGRVETAHKVTKYAKKDKDKMPKDKIPTIKAGEPKEKGKLYIEDGEIVIG